MELQKAGNGHQDLLRNKEHLPGLPICFSPKGWYSGVLRNSRFPAAGMVTQCMFTEESTGRISTRTLSVKTRARKCLKRKGGPTEASKAPPTALTCPCAEGAAARQAPS